MKLTAWYKSNQKPVRVGIYERIFNDGERTYSYWSGKSWGVSCFTPEGAYKNKKVKTSYPNLQWRGIAK